MACEGYGETVARCRASRGRRSLVIEVSLIASALVSAGLFNPVSEPFCAICNRVRLTADGQLRTCLFSIDGWDLRGPPRAGATDRELADRFVQTMESMESKGSEGADRTPRCRPAVRP